MKKQFLVSLILISSLIAPLCAQQPQSSAAARQQDDDEVVRITTNLVQVDAVVTDDKGRPVTDLRPEDFEILEDARPQTITNFSFISSALASGEQVAAATPAPAKNAPVRPARLRLTDPHRTIVLVVDDLGMSFESINFTRQALKKFLDEQMRPDDVVAIVRTSGGVGALQQLTSDKRQLSAAIERVRWNSLGRTGLSAVQSLNGQNVGPGSPVLDTLKSLNFILAGLKGLPGRKSLLLFSDTFVVFPDLKGNELEEFEKTFKAANADLANQASVVIYTIDPRGLPIFGINADSAGKEALLSDTKAPSSQELYMRRSLRFQQTQIGLSYVARQTGGFLVSGTNDITNAVRRIMGDLNGYYLIGYRPSENTFKDASGRNRFRRITVNVKRPGLNVRSRRGFFGLSEDERRGVPRTRSEQLLAAISSPFQTGGVNLRLTTLFGSDLASGSYVRTLLHVDANALTFKPDAEGWQTAVMEVLAMTFDENGQILEQVTREEKIQAKGATHQRLLRNGLVYSFDVPVKKAGSYQLRVAVRDAASERIGSAQQFIEVPDLSKSELALSGILARGVNPATAASADAATDAAAAGLFSGPPKISEAEAGTDAANVQPGPEVRRLRRGMALEYRYSIFNARRAGVGNLPQLETQTILFRDGQQVFAGGPKPFDPSGQSAVGSIQAGGRLMLGTEMTPGEYILQIVVTDTLASGERRTVTQWIDFEVVR
jgi:VWFA-related protein